eukprot:5255413-Pleurochrysis_carterae.AAC.1
MPPAPSAENALCVPLSAAHLPLPIFSPMRAALFGARSRSPRGAQTLSASRTLQRRDSAQLNDRNANAQTNEMWHRAIGSVSIRIRKKFDFLRTVGCHAPGASRGLTLRTQDLPATPIQSSPCSSNGHHFQLE